MFFELAANLLHASVLHRIRTSRLAAIWIGLSGIWLFVIVDAESMIQFPRTLSDFPVVLLRTMVPYIQGILIFRILKDQGPNVSDWVAPVALPFLIIVADFGWIPTIAIVLVGFPMLLISSLGDCRFWRVAAILGGISYPLYATHIPLQLILGPLAGTLTALIFAMGWTLRDRIRLTPAKKQPV